MPAMAYGRRLIQYQVVRTDRATLQVAVHPDLSVVLRVPKHSSFERIQQAVHNKRQWIVKQLRYFDQFQPRTSPREYVSGESHHYLGRQYRLHVIPEQQRSVKLWRGRLCVHTDVQDRLTVKTLVERWYRQQAERHFVSLFEQHMRAFASQGFAKPTLVIRSMKKRWGSLSAKGTLTLNLRLMQAPRHCIEYVIVHELCHLVEHAHSKRFYQLLEEQMPDWKDRKQQLERLLA